MNFKACPFCGVTDAKLKKEDKKNRIEIYIECQFCKARGNCEWFKKINRNENDYTIREVMERVIKGWNGVFLPSEKKA